MKKAKLKKTLSLLVAITFTISSIAQAAPYSTPATNHLRPAAAVNTLTSHDIRDGIKSFPVGNIGFDGEEEKKDKSLANGGSFNTTPGREGKGEEVTGLFSKQAAYEFFKTYLFSKENRTLLIEFLIAGGWKIRKGAKLISPSDLSGVELNNVLLRTISETGLWESNITDRAAYAGFKITGDPIEDFAAIYEMYIWGSKSPSNLQVMKNRIRNNRLLYQKVYAWEGIVKDKQHLYIEKSSFSQENFKKLFNAMGRIMTDQIMAGNIVEPSGWFYEEKDIIHLWWTVADATIYSAHRIGPARKIWHAHICLRPIEQQMRELVNKILEEGYYKWVQKYNLRKIYIDTGVRKPSLNDILSFIDGTHVEQVVIVEDEAIRITKAWRERISYDMHDFFPEGSAGDFRRWLIGLLRSIDEARIKAPLTYALKLTWWLKDRFPQEFDSTMIMTACLPEIFDYLRDNASEDLCLRNRVQYTDENWYKILPYLGLSVEIYDIATGKIKREYKAKIGFGKEYLDYFRKVNANMPDGVIDFIWSYIDTSLNDATFNREERDDSHDNGDFFGTKFSSAGEDFGVSADELMTELGKLYREVRTPEEDYHRIRQQVIEFLSLKEKEGREALLKDTIGQIASSNYFREGNVVYIPRQSGRLYIIGDIHGDTISLETILKEIGFYEEIRKPDPSIHLVFLGDYIHNGINSLGALSKVIQLKLSYPQNVTVLRGSHEKSETLEWCLGEFAKWKKEANTRRQELISRFGYVKSNPYLILELIAKYGEEYAEKIMNELQLLFTSLPTVAITGNGIVISHAAPPYDSEVSLIDIAANNGLAAEMRINWLMTDQDGPNEIVEGKEHRKIRETGFRRFMNNIGGKIFICGHNEPASGNIQFKGTMAVVISTDVDSPESGYYIYRQGAKPCYAVFDLDRDYKAITKDNIIFFNIEFDQRIPKQEQDTLLTGEFIQGARDTAVELAKKAGNIALDYRSRLDEFKKARKDDDLIAIEADVKIKRLLLDALATRYPLHRFVAGGPLLHKTVDLNDRNKDSKFVWMVDPIDGTKAFVDKNSNYYGISIVLLYNGYPVMGIFYAPEYEINGEKRALFEASYGREGAYLNGRRIYISSSSDLNSKMAIIYKKMPDWFKANDWEKKFARVQDFTTSGTLCLCRTAASGSLEGEHPVFYAFPQPKIWGAIIGGYLVIKSGGAFKGLNGDDIFPVSEELLRQYEPKFSTILAGPKEILSDIKSLLADSIEDEKIDHLIADLCGEDEDKVWPARDAIIEIIQTTGNLEIAERILKLLDSLMIKGSASGSFLSAKAAIDILGEIKYYPAIPTLIDILNDKSIEDRFIRGYAAEALGRIGRAEDRIVEAMIRIAKDKDEEDEARKGSASALVNLGDESLLDFFLMQLDFRELNFKFAISDYLKKLIKNKGLIDVFEKTYLKPLRDEYEYIGFNAGVEIDMIRNLLILHDNCPELRQLIKKSLPHFRKEASRDFVEDIDRDIAGSHDDWSLFLASMKGAECQWYVSIGDLTDLHPEEYRIFETEDLITYGTVLNSVKGTVIELLSRKEGYLRIDALDECKNPIAVITNFMLFLVSGNSADLDKELILFDSIKDMFASQGIVLPEKLTIGNFVKAVKAAKCKTTKQRKPKQKAIKPHKAKPISPKEILTKTHARYSVTITNRLGLHVRVASIIEGLAKNSKSRVTITKGRKKADASSLEQLAKLAAEEGDTVVIEAKGEDAMDVAMKIEEALKDESILGNIDSGIKSSSAGQDNPVVKFMIDEYDIDLEKYSAQPFGSYQEFIKFLSQIIISRHFSGVFFVSLDGLSGVGKSTLADSLKERLERDDKRVVIIKRDWFLRPPVEKKVDGDSARLDYLKEILEKIRAFDKGRDKTEFTIGVERLYNSQTEKLDHREDIVIDNNTIVIMDGGRNIENPWKDYFDLRILMLSDPDTALKRRIEKEKQRISLSPRYREHVEESFKETSEQFSERVRKNYRNVDLFVLTEDFQKPILFFGESFNNDIYPVIWAQKVSAMKRLLDGYYLGLKEKIRIRPYASVEETILSIFFHPKLKKGNLRSLGYKRTRRGRFEVLRSDSDFDHLAEIRYFTSQGRPIEAMISGYSFKVKNPLRCYPHPFDLAEIAGLFQLNFITELVKSVYPPGITFTIVADGRQSAGIYLDDTQAADIYRETIQKLISMLSLQDIISIVDLDEILPPEFKDEYNRWVEYFEEEKNLKTSFCQRIISSSIYSLDWSGYSAEEAEKIIKEGPSQHPQFFEEAKRRAIQYMAMQTAVRELDVYKRHYPHKLRFTFHPKPGQISINLVNPESRVSPWHGTCGVSLDGTPVVDYRYNYENRTDWLPIYYHKNDDYPLYFKEMLPLSRIPALIFASGRGSRLSPITTVRSNANRFFPKTIIPIANIPNLEILLQNALGEGISSFYVTLSHGVEDIKAVLGKYRDNLTFIKGETEIVKPRLAQSIILDEYAHNFPEDIFWIFHTDVICPNTPYAECYKYFMAAKERSPDLLGCMGVVFQSYDDFKIAKEKGEAALNSYLVDTDNRIIKIFRKRDIVTREDFMRIHTEFCRRASPEVARLAYDKDGRPLLPTNASFYLLTKDILDEAIIEDKESFDIGVFSAVGGKIIAYFMGQEVSSVWQHIAMPEDLLAAQFKFLENPGYASTLIPPRVNSNNIKDSVIGKGSKISKSAVLRECFVAEDCRISNADAARSLFLPGTVVSGIDFENAVVSGDFSLPVIQAIIAQNSIKRISDQTIIAGEDGKLYIAENFTPHIPRGSYPLLKVLSQATTGPIPGSGHSLAGENVPRLKEVATYLEEKLWPGGIKRAAKRPRMIPPSPYEKWEVSAPEELKLQMSSHRQPNDVLNPDLAVAITGAATKDCTKAGRHLAHMLAVSTIEYGRKNGITISFVAGGAPGIDKAALKAAIEKQGMAVAVQPWKRSIGIFTDENLKRKLLKYGGIVSARLGIWKERSFEIDFKKFKEDIQLEAITEFESKLTPASISSLTDEEMEAMRHACPVSEHLRGMFKEKTGILLSKEAKIEYEWIEKKGVLVWQLRLIDGPRAYKIIKEGQKWEFSCKDIDLALERDAIITALSDIVVVVECGAGGGTVDTGLKSILQGVPLVVVNWNYIKHDKGPALTEGNQQLMEVSIPADRPKPRCFPQEQEQVDLLRDQEVFNEHWHAFLDYMLNNRDLNSCRPSRFILRKRGVDILRNQIQIQELFEVAA